MYFYSFRLKCERIYFETVKKYCLSTELNIISTDLKVAPKNNSFHQFLVRTGWKPNNQTNSYTALIKGC